MMDKCRACVVKPEFIDALDSADSADGIDVDNMDCDKVRMIARFLFRLWYRNPRSAAILAIKLEFPHATLRQIGQILAAAEQYPKPVQGQNKRFGHHPFMVYKWEKQLKAELGDFTRIFGEVRRRRK